MFAHAGRLPRNAFYESQDRAPGAIVSIGASIAAAGKQLGLGAFWTLTPKSSGRIGIRVFGRGQVNAASSLNILNINYGTGAAPAFNAAYTGNALVPDQSWAVIPFNAGVNADYAWYAEIGGLVRGTAYWFDLVSYGFAPATSVVAINTVCSIEELK